MLPLQHSGCCPNPQLSPGNQITFSSCLEQREKIIPSSPLKLKIVVFSFFFLTTEYEGPCLQLCNENHIILSPVVGGLWVKSCEAECVCPSVRKHFLPLPSDPSVLGPPSVLGDVQGPLREHCQESALLPCLQTVFVILFRPWYKVILL